MKVADQDAAKAFYVDVLGCELRLDKEFWPGARWVEVVPPGSEVGIALLTEDGGLPIGIRLASDDAEAGHEVLSGHARELQDVLHLDGAPPMFTFRDPDDNLLVLMEERSA